MKLNVKWVWTLSAVIYVAIVLIGYAVYVELSPLQEPPADHMQHETSSEAKSSHSLSVLRFGARLF
ncbi:hypothetical protein PQS34_18375 [Bacillus altitudinis]|uniref:hypothetical protein n=1 Tax=Bacillus altitudinis TaxID=293387 RepID=UPI001F4D6990|nr:hypothetical protein [Bacillus altitudinis]MDC7798051.1 hypothetical protein [Bacillus altitudinis]UNG00565.1 hypothetical protein MMZ59_15485 [Bacillus altitudinis]